MTDADSKTLEDMKGRVILGLSSEEQDWLISKVKEQDREISYQRRHRKWTLKEARDWHDTTLYDETKWHECQVARDAIWQQLKKAEAELADCKERVRELEEALREIRQEATGLMAAGGSTLIDKMALKARFDGFVATIDETAMLALEAQEQTKEMGDENYS